MQAGYVSETNEPRYDQAYQQQANWQPPQQQYDPPVAQTDWQEQVPKVIETGNDESYQWSHWKPREQLSDSQRAWAADNDTADLGTDPAFQEPTWNPEVEQAELEYAASEVPQAEIPQTEVVQTEAPQTFEEQAEEEQTDPLLEWQVNSPGPFELPNAKRYAVASKEPGEQTVPLLQWEGNSETTEISLEPEPPTRISREPLPPSEIHELETEDHSEIELVTVPLPSFSEPAQPELKVEDAIQLETNVQEELVLPQITDVPTNRLATARGIDDKSNVEHASVPQQPESVKDTQQASFEPRVIKPDVAPVRMDKQVRKANWAEIERETRAELSNGFSSWQQPTLVRQRATPQAESRAREHIRYGESLTRRRAFFAAREEFIRALLLISGSYNSGASQGYPERFAQALVAIEEANDFQGVPNEASNNKLYQQKVLTHKTRLVAPQNIATTTPVNAMALYSGFAQEQIEQAIGYSVAGSEALHALGKLESLSQDSNMKLARTSQLKALIFFRAAIKINPSNAVCANDLGVLLFNMGHLPEAEHALKTSLGSSQSQMSWSNLASVHNYRASTAEQGDQQQEQRWLANLATKEAQDFANNPQFIQSAGDNWATAVEFQNNAAFPDTGVQPASNSSSIENASGQGTNRRASLMQKVKGWF